MTLVWVPFVLIFAVVLLSAAEYVVYRVIYGHLMTIDDSLSLNPNRCHHPLITPLQSVSVKCFDLTKFLMICRAKKSSKWLEAPLVAKLPRFGDSVPWSFQNLYMKLKHRQLSRYFLLTCYLRFPLFRSIFSKE